MNPTKNNPELPLEVERTRRGECGLCGRKMEGMIKAIGCSRGRKAYTVLICRECLDPKKGEPNVIR